jgi:hypothetical protein
MESRRSYSPTRCMPWIVNVATRIRAGASTWLIVLVCILASARMLFKDNPAGYINCTLRECFL